MNKSIGGRSITEQSSVNQSKLTNMNHIHQKTNEKHQAIELKIKDQILYNRKTSVSKAESKRMIGKENTEKKSTDNEKNLNEVLEKLETSKKNLAELEESKKNIEKDLGKIESFQKGIKEADEKLKKFEESWRIGKFVTGWKESTLAQKILTFAKIAITVAISTALFVLSGGGLVIALLVASLSIVLLHYFAKDVINIAKEKLMSALSEACKGAIDFECKGIKDATEGIIQTTEKIKTSLDGCNNDLEKQEKHIGALKGQIETLNNSIQKEIKNKDDEIKKQKEKIAEITKELANTISSSLTNSAQVEKKARENLSCVEEAQKDIAVIEKTCDEISEKSQKIKNLSDGITNKIKKFNKTTVDKLKKFVEIKDDGTVFEKSKLSRLLSKEETTKNNTEKLSKKIDDLEDEIFPQKSDKFYSKAGFFAKESENSNESIKNLINKISKSNVDPTKFAKLLVEIINDQKEMNKEITKSSTKISNLAKKIEDEHAKKVKDFCTKIATTLATVKTNEKTLLDIQNSLKEKLLSKVKELLIEKFKTKEEASTSLKKSEYENLLDYFFNDDKDEFQIVLEENNFIELKQMLLDLKFTEISIDNNTKVSTQNIIDIIGEASNILNNIKDINNKCTENISKIKDKDINDIKNEANEINESIKRLQNYSKKLNVEIINKSAHIATASAGLIIGGTAVGVLGTTVGLPVTVAAGGAVLLGTALYKVIEHYKSNKN